MKQLTDDPWDKVEGNIELDASYESKVVNIADYGVFVDLGDSIEGFQTCICDNEVIFYIYDRCRNNFSDSHV